MKNLLMVLMCLIFSIGVANAHDWDHDNYRGGWAHAPDRGYYHPEHGRFVEGLVIGSLIESVVRPRYYQPGQVYERSYSIQQAPVYCVDPYGYQYVCQYQTVRVYNQP